MTELLHGNVLSAQCPARSILQRMMSRWGGLVLIVLLDGTHRYGEIKAKIDGISERMLIQTLKQLEQSKLITRQSFGGVPPHVEYSLTDLGKEGAEKVADLVKWLEMHLPDILGE